MARLVRDPKLETRTARARLPIEPNPIRRLEIGFHLGYRRLSSGGTWIARRFAQGGHYRENRLGVADDTQECRWRGSVLDYRPCAEGRARVVALRAATGGRPRYPHQGPFSVADAAADYLKALEGRGGKSAYATRAGRPRLMCLPSLGSTAGRQTDRQKRLEDWHHGLAEKSRLWRAAKPGR